jgi:hypothetical protein
VNGVIGADEKIGASLYELISGGEHQLTYTLPIAAINALHILGKRMVVHRDLGVIVRAEILRALQADGSITERCTLCGAGNDTNMAWHNLILQNFGGPVNRER